MKVKKIRNKNELSPNPKKLPEKKIVVRFDFLGDDGNKYKIPKARLKINENGGASCLIKDEEGKWKAIKGKLKSIKMVYETKKVNNGTRRTKGN
jgi:hypothetical protein